MSLAARMPNSFNFCICNYRIQPLIDSRTWGLLSSNCFAISITTQQNRDVTCMHARIIFSVAISTQCNAFMVNKYPSYFRKSYKHPHKKLHSLWFITTLSMKLLWYPSLGSNMGIKILGWKVCTMCEKKIMKEFC